MQDFTPKEIAEVAHHMLLLLQQKRFTSLKTSFDYDLLSSHAQALSILDQHKSLAVGEVKNRLGLSFGSVTKIIDSLEQKKLVNRRKFARSDLRSTEVQLTQKGRQAAKETQRCFMEYVSKSLSHLSSENINGLLQGVKALNNQLHSNSDGQSCIKAKRSSLIKRKMKLKR